MAKRLEFRVRVGCRLPVSEAAAFEEAAALEGKDLGEWVREALIDHLTISEYNKGGFGTSVP